MKKKLRDSLFAKFLFSYIAVMLIPAVILYCLYTKQTAETVINEIHSSVTLDHKYAISLIDNMIANLGNTANQFQLTRGFRSYQETHDFYSSESGETYGEIVEDLFSLNRMNPFANNFFVYFYERSCAFSVRGLHQIDTFINADYRYDDYTPAEYLRLLQGVREPTVLGSSRITIHSSSANYITFIYPLYERFNKVAAAAVFCVDSERITELLSARMTQHNTSTYIFDADQQLIYSNNPVYGFTLENEADFGDQYWVISHSSQESGWKYITLLPKAQPVLYDIMRSGQNFIIYSSLTLLLSAFVVWYVMRLNYNPILRLKEKASVITDSNAHEGELETISNALDYLHQQNTMLSSAAIDNQTLVTNNQLRKLLNGTYSTIEDFNSDSASGLHYTGSHLFVAVIMFHHSGDCTEPQARNISSTLENYMQSNYIYHLEPDKLITVNCVDQPTSYTVTDAFGTMLKLLSLNYSISATVGVGSMVDNTLALGRSYMEAQSAVDYRFVKGKGTVILYDNLCQEADAHPSYPYQKFERLNNALAAKDNLAADRQIQELLEYVTAGNIPLFWARGVCFDILRAVNESERQLCSGGNLLDVEMLQQLASTDTALEMVQMIQTLRSSLSTKRQPSDGSPQNLLEQITSYLNSNCCSCDFSVRQLADAFGLLPSNISAFFKAQTGGNILDYVIEQRMKQAKRLLTTTNMPLGDIGQAVGYYNVSSFVRRFRQHQGVTPGVFRDSAHIETGDK